MRYVEEESAIGREGALLRLRVNGSSRPVYIEPWVTLLDALRERLGLTGTRKGCDHGQCGACTVLINGQRALSCLSLACAHQDADILTIEGLAAGERLHPLQAAFVSHDAFQCGYCTSGQIMNALGMLMAGAPEGDDAIREALSGSLCRCGAYNNIIAAVREVIESGHFQRASTPPTVDGGLPSDLHAECAELRP